MARRRLKKAVAQRLHAYGRALLRYDIELTDELHKRLIRAVQNGRSTPIEKQSLRLSVHEYNLDGKMIRFVYDKQRKQIVTFLHIDESKYLEVG
jgi:hypothetical protein